MQYSFYRSFVLSLLINLNLKILLMKIFYVGYQYSLSKVKSKNGSMFLQPNPFTHGSCSLNYLYAHIRTISMIRYVRKLNLFRDSR